MFEDYKLKCFLRSELYSNTGTTINEAATAAIVPKISDTPRPPNTASPARRVDAKIIAAAVKKIGFARVAVAYAMASAFDIALSLISDAVKSIRSREFLELIPMSAINPIRDVAVRKKVSLVNISMI